MTTADCVPVLLPELGSDDARIVQWLIPAGGSVAAGDRVAEVLAGGVLFHLASDVTGVLTRIDCERDCTVHPGETLAWIDPVSD